MTDQTTSASGGQHLEVRIQPFRGAVPDVITSFDLRRPYRFVIT